MQLAARSSIASRHGMRRPPSTGARASHGRPVAQSWLELTLIIVFVAGYYLHHSLFLTETVFVPTYLATFAGLGLLILNVQRLPAGLFSFGLVVVAIALASILCNPQFWGGWAGAFGGDYA